MIPISNIKAEHLPWLARARRRIAGALRQGRLPHGLLIHAPRGVGADSLALWIGQLALCRAPGEEPCGTCAACRLIAAGNHPDLHWITLLEDKRDVLIEQVRELSEAFGFKSYRGGRKVGVIAPADLMNDKAANALLKTLEEPPPDALLVLVCERPSRLPATIVSRCQRISIPAPLRAVALEWLSAREPDLASWNEVLEFAGGAPLRALELHASGFANLHREMNATLNALRERSLDIPATAGGWAGRNAAVALEDRLSWIETWITNSLREAFQRGANLQSLPGIRKIRGLYAVLDRVREFKLELSKFSLNAQLATEELLLRTQVALAA
ncbi:MAG TPA: DNA polymerase III subunit delta' [Steroidobacteraceae bacterium]|nr:DNA polymerase III subunit delta' [Steroidobacteraceae bacterium]